MNLFHSARLKLTAFYFASLVVFCLLLTFGVHIFTNYELSRGDDAQRGAVHRLVQEYSTMNGEGTPPGPPGDQSFATTQRRQANVTRQHLNRDFLLIDLGLLAAGAVLSYWYAGRTLRPIEAAHEQQKRFTSDASHELRTPLASMKLENEIFLRQKQFSDTDARELIASNLEEVDRLEKLATNLLALNQYEHGDTLSHAQVAVEDLVDDAITQVRHSRAAHKVKFTKTIVPAAVDVNKDSLVELLTILLDNAVKYGSKGGAVNVSGDMVNDRYVIVVRDHGLGIAEEDLPHIFERMYRGDKARSNKVSGHGIGLSLAQQIATANDATLIARNHSEGGAEFVLTLQ